MERKTQKSRSALRIFGRLFVRFHYGQLVAKCKVLGSEIRSDIELRTYEQNNISKRFHHDYMLGRRMQSCQ